MKKFKILPFLLLSLMVTVFTISCDRELPYEDPRNGTVVVDVSRVPGTAGTVATDPTAVNIAVRLQKMEKADGPFQKIQLACLYTDSQTKAQKYIIVQDDITSLPYDININFPTLLTKLGIAAHQLGDNFTFTANVVMEDGTLIPGYNEITKQYNHTNFADWLINGRKFSNRVGYNTVCTFDYDIFKGNFTATEASPFGGDSYTVTFTHYPNPPETLPEGVTAADLYGIQIDGLSPNIIGVEVPHFYVWINSVDFSLYIPSQLVGYGWHASYGDVYLYNPTATECNTCNNTMTFTSFLGFPAVNAGYGNFTFTFTKQ